MTKYNTHEAEIRFPTVTGEGLRANQLHEGLSKDILETFKAIDGHGHGSFVSYDATSAAIGHRGRLELAGVKVYLIRHHMKANAALKKLVRKYLELFSIPQITYVNFSGEFETLDTFDSEDEIVVVTEVKEVGNGKRADKK